jgi:predicted ATPase/DNA-binding CsgD family transcriptional regulator
VAAGKSFGGTWERGRPAATDLLFEKITHLCDALGLARCYVSGERELVTGMAKARTDAEIFPWDSAKSGEADEDLLGVPLQIRDARGLTGNLPAETSSFVGRQRELSEVGRLLGETRLLTLTGPGGCGKTRLALRLAREAAASFSRGAWWVELAPVPEAVLVPQRVGRALGVREMPGRPLAEVIVELLRSAEALLVLDNCEHLIEGCAELADALLRGCPGVKIVATSRETLRVPGEVSWLVPSLSVPDPQARALLDYLSTHEAVRLFVERASAASPGFALTEENAPAVIRICRRLDGMPLALELAAALTRTLSAQQIAERLDDRFLILTGGSRVALPRQRTLLATMDWSHGLLPKEEKILFRRLSVFAGTFTLEATEAICPGEGVSEGEVLELLARLVEKSLVSVIERDGEARYGMLETIRAYGLKKLGASREEATLRDRHALFFLELAERASPRLKGPEQLAWLKTLDKELDNLRGAMAWLLESRRYEEAANFGWALWFYWWVRGRFAELRRRMEEALSRGGRDMPARARALFVAGTMACGQGDYREAAAMLDEALSLFGDVGDELGMAHTLSSAGFAALGEGRHEEGLVLIGRAKDLSLKIGEKWGAAYMFSFLAVVRRDLGETADAKRLAEQGLALSRETGDRLGGAVASYVLATLVQEGEQRERKQAAQLFGEALRLSAEMGEKTDLFYCLQGLGDTAWAGGDGRRAATLWGAAEALSESIQVAAYFYAPDQSLHESRMAACRGALGERAFRKAWEEGRMMPQERAVAYATKQQDTLTLATVPRGETLSNRELEVLKLAAEGLTDIQIAERLYLSPRTVGNHLRSVYRKLGVPSRAAAVATAGGLGLI